MRKVLFLWVAAVFMLAACSDDSTTPTQSATGASGEPVELNGTYARECAVNGVDSNYATLAISNTTLTQTSIDYVENKDCTGSSTITQVIGISDFILGDEVSATLESDKATATAWTATITSYTVTPADETAATAASGSDEFGGTTFTAGQTEDFTEHVDDPVLDEILYLDDTDAAAIVLYFGQGKVLDPEDAWTKQ